MQSNVLNFTLRALTYTKLLSWFIGEFLCIIYIFRRPSFACIFFMQSLHSIGMAPLISLWTSFWSSVIRKGISSLCWCTSWSLQILNGIVSLKQVIITSTLPWKLELKLDESWQTWRATSHLNSYLSYYSSKKEYLPEIKSWFEGHPWPPTITIMDYLPSNSWILRT